MFSKRIREASFFPIEGVLDGQKLVSRRVKSPTPFWERLVRKYSKEYAHTKCQGGSLYPLLLKDKEILSIYPPLVLLCYKIDTSC